MKNTRKNTKENLYCRLLKSILLTVVVLFFVQANNTAQATNCSITKVNGGGFSTTITSVTLNGGEYTIVLTVEHDGCGGPSCKELSHYSIEADDGTFSNVSWQQLWGDETMSGNIELSLGNNDPFDGFKLDNVSNIGDGDAGAFTMTYTLTYLQDQQTLAKAGNNYTQIAAFTEAEFLYVLNCGSGNTPPIAIDDTYSTPINTAVSGDVTTNDYDPDGDNLIVNTTLLTGPSHGSVSINNDGTFTYTPDNNYTGTDTFKYEVCDDGTPSECDNAWVTITISNNNGPDSDGDGVPDDEDDYPNDPDRAYNIYYPAGGNGTLAYEDLWPSKGDYDFNDLVIEYRFKTVTSGTNHIVETFANFTIKAFGAGFENGFGFQLANNNIADADILSVTGYDLQEAYISLEANGIEEGQSIPTIIVYDNTFNIMEHPGQGIGVNTEPWAPYVESETLEIYMGYAQGTYTYAQLDIPNFNPFIMVNLNRGTEVHLTNYNPTDLANPWQFGTWDDSSDPNSGRYYKTVSNLPWAIHIPEPFEWPIEKQDIIWVHLKFAEWAESGGQLYQDWYKDLPGYRNNSLIYDQP